MLPAWMDWLTRRRYHTELKERESKDVWGKAGVVTEAGSDIQLTHEKEEEEEGVGYCTEWKEREAKDIRGKAKTDGEAVRDSLPTHKQQQHDVDDDDDDD